MAWSGFVRVRKDDGIAVILCPDLQSVCGELAKGNLLDPLYTTTSGPISPIDILYGYRKAIAQGNEYMAHKGGFTYSVLKGAFEEAGFKLHYGGTNPSAYELFIVSFKQNISEEEAINNGKLFLPPNYSWKKHTKET